MIISQWLMPQRLASLSRGTLPYLSHQTRHRPPQVTYPAPTARSGQVVTYLTLPTLP